MQDLGLQPMYFHISRVYLNPFELFLQPMTLATAEEKEVANGIESETCLKARAVWYNCYKAMASVPLVKDLTIDVDFLKIAMHDRPLEGFVVGLVLAEETSCGLHQLWPVRVAKSKAKAKAKAKVGAAKAKGKAAPKGSASSGAAAAGPVAIEDGAAEEAIELLDEGAEGEADDGVPVAYEGESDNEDVPEEDDVAEKLVADLKKETEEDAAEEVSAEVISKAEPSMLVEDDSDADGTVTIVEAMGAASASSSIMPMAAAPGSSSSSSAGPSMPSSVGIPASLVPAVGGGAELEDLPSIITFWLSSTPILHFKTTSRPTKTTTESS